MFTNAEKNYLLNIALGVISLTCILTGFLLKLKLPALMAFINVKILHEWTGYLMTSLIILHLCMHLQWLQAITKMMANNKQKLTAIILALFFSAFLVLGLITLLPAAKSPGKGGNRNFKQTEGKPAPTEDAGHSFSLPNQ